MKMPSMPHTPAEFATVAKKELKGRYNQDSYIIKLKNQVQLNPRWINESVDLFATEQQQMLYNKAKVGFEAYAKNFVALQMVDSMADMHQYLKSELYKAVLLSTMQALFMDTGFSGIQDNIRAKVKDLNWDYIENIIKTSLNINSIIDYTEDSPIDLKKLEEKGVELVMFFPNASLSETPRNISYLTDETIHQINMPYVSWKCEDEEYLLIDSIPKTSSRSARYIPGAPPETIRREFVQTLDIFILNLFDKIGKEATRIVKIDIGAIFKLIAQGIEALVKAGLSLATGNFAGAGSALKDGWDKMSETIDKGGLKATINKNSEKAAEDMEKLFKEFKKSLYGETDSMGAYIPGTGLFDTIKAMDNKLASMTGSDGNPLPMLSPSDGEGIKFILSVYNTNYTSFDVDTPLLQKMYTQMAGYGNRWTIPHRVGTVHNTEHVSQSLDWGKKKFHHIDHIYIKPRDKDLDHSERMRYPQGSGYGAYCWASRDTWKVDGSSGW